MTSEPTEVAPGFVTGELGRVDPLDPDPAAAVPEALEAFHLTAAELVARRTSTDERGDRHVRYQQVRDGRPVIGAELVVHVDRDGVVYALNGSALGGMIVAEPAISDATAHAIVERENADLAAIAERRVLIRTAAGTFDALEVTVAGSRGMDPVRDLVYLDLAGGTIVADYAQIQAAENRRVNSANHTWTQVGTHARYEGEPATADVDVNAAYDHSGEVYAAFRGFWNRDSYDNAGASLRSTVRYGTAYCNAFWDGAELVFGDGDPSIGCLSPTRGVDVTAHEFGHAIIETESGLVSSGEPGGINESTADIFGAFVDAWTDGGGTGTLAANASTWVYGEDVLAPWMRTMCDPTEDGESAEVWSIGVGGLDTHYSAGVGNLAFCLVVNGGSHPHNQTSTIVTGIGFDKAIRVFYKAQVDILTSTATFATWRTATEQAAVQLGYDAATRLAVTCAWEAVKVGPVTGTCPALATLPSITSLTDGVALGAQSGAVGSQAFYTIAVPPGAASLVVSVSGGSGNADLYVQYAGRPNPSWYLCRSANAGTTEGCTIAAPASGGYWLMLRGTAAYSGVAITATATFNDPLLSNGVGVSLSSAGGTYQYWRVSPPPEATLTVKLASGSTGDADLYVRRMARPTETIYDCHSVGPTLNETCTIAHTPKGGVYEVMVRTKTPFRIATLTATWTSVF